MTDTALIQDGIVVQVWRGATITELPEPHEGMLEVPDGGVVCGMRYASGSFSVPSPPPTTNDLLAYAAEKRWLVETSGITLAGTEIRTDEKSQNRVSGAALLALSDPDLTVINWEATPGVWVEVSAAQMKTIGIAVGRHVQACFSTLKAVQAAINSGTITTTAEIDAADWPG